jgi:hypothetical protein
MDQQNLDQLTETLEKLNESLGGLGTNANTLGNQLGKQFPNAAKPGIAALEGLGSAVTSVTKALYRGERGMKVMADGVDQLVDGVQTAVALFTLLTPMGKALSLTTKILINGAALLGKVFSTFNKLSAENSDKLFKAYQNLSEIGAVGDTIDSLNQSLMRAGFTAAELDNFTAMLKKNSKDLGYFGASAADGAQNLSALSGAIVKSEFGRQLEMLGYTADGVGNAMATYMVQQAKLGRLQQKSTAELITESAKFALELDKMARFTGQSREEQQQARKALQEDERYAAFTAGGAGGGDVQALESFFATIQDPETRRGLQHLVAAGGMITSDEAGKVFMTDPQAYAKMKAVLDKTMSAVDASQAFSKEIGAYSKSGLGQLTAITGEGVGVKLGGAGGGVAQAAYAKSLETAAAKVGMTVDQFLESEQGRAMATAEAEKNRQVDSRRAQMNTAQSMDTFVREGVNPATASLEALSRAADKITGKTLPSVPGGKATTSGVPEGAGGTKSAADAMKFFQAAGWTKEQAAGIVGNLQVESGKNLNTNAVGDGGKAKGVAQWHPDRQANFAREMGKTVENSTLEDQLKFIDWELKNTEKSAGDKLKAARTAAEAAQIVDKQYERSSGAALAQRMANASALLEDKNGPATRGYNPDDILLKSLGKVDKTGPATRGYNPDDILGKKNFADTSSPFFKDINQTGPTKGYNPVTLDANLRKEILGKGSDKQADDLNAPLAPQWTDFFSQMLDKLDTLNNTSNNGVDVSKKILRQAQ